MNVIQKVVDAGLLGMVVLIVGSVIVGVATPKAAVAPTVESFTYTPGAFLGNDTGAGPRWNELKAITANIR